MFCANLGSNLEDLKKNEGNHIGIHLALFQFGTIKAIVRLDVSDQSIGQVWFVAVETNNQGKGFGNLVMSEVEKVSIAGGDKQMILHAQE